MLPRKDAKEKSTNLDPYHSHFILVDNALLNEFGGEIKLRARLEKALTTQNEIPIVMLLLGGGRNTVVQVKEAIRNHISCVFFDETGKFSNVFPFILKKIDQNEKDLFTDGKFSSGFRQLIKEKMIQEMNKINVQTNIDPSDETVEPILNNIEEIFQPNNLHLLSYFEFKSNFESNDVDVAILKSFFKSLKYDNDEKDLLLKYKEQLELCLNCDFNPTVVHAFLMAIKKLENKEEFTIDSIAKELKTQLKTETLKEIENKIKNDDEFLKRYKEQLKLNQSWELDEVANLMVFILKNRNIKNLFQNNRFSKEIKGILIKQGLNPEIINDFEYIFLKNTETELKRRYREQLKLCLKWNRFDMAKEYILTFNTREQVGSLDNFMFEAIKDNRSDFVKDFLINGFVLKNWTTYRIILKLYNIVNNLPNL